MNNFFERHGASIAHDFIDNAPTSDMLKFALRRVHEGTDRQPIFTSVVGIRSWHQWNVELDSLKGCFLPLGSGEQLPFVLLALRESGRIRSTPVGTPKVSKHWCMARYVSEPRDLCH